MDAEGYPEELREELCRLSDWLGELLYLYRHRISIRIIDAQSLVGIYKCLRYGIRGYPGFIVDRRHAYAGWDRKRLEGIIDCLIRA
ncbi:MAG: hypothetical protein JRH07_11955 [Deltaproteobacteria bacterium]|nr:hypothetical protein [Deltaproteobacteria bacterium]MBW2122546.1 hypothetical protein [Deltaproteobacteria bacterium]